MSSFVFDQPEPPQQPHRLRLLRRVVTIAAVLIALVTLAWVFTGLPAPVASAMGDALYAPCPAQYAAATNAQDSSVADGYVLRPRTRFERAITCGSERRRRAAATP